MFNCIGGDFPKSTAYSNGYLVIGFGKKVSLKGNIEEIIVLPSSKKKIISFECHMKDGCKFIANADSTTFEKIQVDKISAAINSTQVYSSSTQNYSVGTISDGKKGKGKGKAIAIVIGCLFLVSIVGSVIGGNTNESVGTESSRAIERVTNTTAEQSLAIESVLSECAIKVASAEHIQSDETLDDAYGNGEKGYRIKSDRTGNIILYLTSEGDIFNVRWADHDFYKDGAVIDKLSNYVVSDEEVSTLQYNCQETISKLLKSPKSADFPGITEWAFRKENGNITIQSYVDAQNSFGAEIRSEFQFIVNSENVITSLIFDGKEYIEN